MGLTLLVIHRLDKSAGALFSSLKIREMEFSGEFDLHDLAANSGVSVADIIKIFDTIAQAVAEQDRVELHHIGVFSLKDRAPRHGTTPGGEPWETPERREIIFQPSDVFALKVEQFTNGESPII